MPAAIQAVTSVMMMIRDTHTQSLYHMQIQPAEERCTDKDMANQL